MQTGSRLVHVLPRSGGGWELRETAGGPVLAKPTTKRDALAQATVVLEANGGGRIVVLGPDGSVERTFTVDPAPPRPRWYVRPGVFRWLFPVLLGVQLVGRLVDRRTDALGLFLALGLVVLFVFVLAAALASRALDRAHTPHEESERE